MLIFSPAKLVILSVPKTGTTALESALGPQAAIWVQNPPELKHAPVYRYNRFFRPMLEKFVAPDIEVVALMREPVSWLGSWWRYRQRPGMEGTRNATTGIDFDAFVDAYCKGQQPDFAAVGSQAKFLEAQPNGTKVDRLFRYEDQGRFLDFLQERLKLEISLPRENVSPAIPMELSPATEAKYRRKYAAEFELWESIG